jgi:hypothetical protein
VRRIDVKPVNCKRRSNNPAADALCGLAEGWGMKGVELYGRVRYAVQIEGLSHREAARDALSPDGHVSG